MIAQILGLLYAMAQVLVPSLPPAPLSSQQLLADDKYMGKWYFIGVASWDEEDIGSFKNIDNSVTEWRKINNNTMVMTAAISENNECKMMSWSYTADPDFDPIMEEGGRVLDSSVKRLMKEGVHMYNWANCDTFADNWGIAIDGKWVKCPSCLLMVKYHFDDAILRIMLFARSQDSRAELVKAFKSKMRRSFIISDFVIPPQNKEFCNLEESS